MKRIVYFTFLLIMFSCSTKSKLESGKPLYEVLINNEDGGGSFQFFEILSEPKEIKMLLNDKNLKKKIDEKDIEKSNFIIINLGEKPSGGFKVGVDEVIETPTNIIISIKEIVPAENTNVIHQITYPLCVLKINSKKSIILNVKKNPE